VTTTWSILCGNFSSFRLFFAQHQTVLAIPNCRRFYRSPACNTCRARYCYGKSVCLSTLVLYRNESIKHVSSNSFCRLLDAMTLFLERRQRLKIVTANPSAMTLYARGKFAIFDRNRRLTWKRHYMLTVTITIDQ